MSKLIVEDVSPTTSPLHNTSFYPDLFVAMRNTRFNQSASGLVDVRKEVGEQLKDVVPVRVFLSFLALTLAFASFNKPYSLFLLVLFPSSGVAGMVMNIILPLCPVQ